MKFGVESFGSKVQLPSSEVSVPVRRKAEAVRAFFVEVGIVFDKNQVATSVGYVQVFIKHLRSTETRAKVGTKHEVFRGVETQVSTWRENSFLHQAVLVETTTEEEAPISFFHSFCK